MPQRISRTIVNFWLDCFLLLQFVTLCWSGVVQQFVFPSGQRSSGWELWGWSYTQWGDFHFGVLATLACSVLLHLILHWSWVCGVVRSHTVGKDRTLAGHADSANTIWGVGLLIVIVNLLGVAIAAAALSIQSPIKGY